jgi:Rnl2 family RNA ligase
MERDPSEWPFTGYEKIAESLDAWLGDDEAAYRALRGVPWIVTEKIHGANFCLLTDGRAIRAAKRKALLRDGEDFFGHAALLDRLAPAITRLPALLRDAGITADLVYIHGELFGGGYPHPDVPKVAGVEPVQTGCWYCPHIELSIFDLAVLTSGERRYVDHDLLARACTELGLLHARPLFRGGYEEAMAYPLGFESTIPALLGLPPLPIGNKAEGVVVKPVRAVTVPRRADLVRPVIKRKIAEFAEDARYHEAEKWASKPTSANTGALDLLRWEISCLVNEARLAAAVSKVGRVGAGDVARAREVMSLVIDDLYTELAAKHAAAVASLAPSERAALASFAEGEARALVELYLGVSP